jgi:SAM-dependent methyltransferase
VYNLVMNSKTVEPQYEALLEFDRQSFGLMSSATWHQDPKRLTFLLSRYKFVSRMLDGQQRVLEVGCADGFGARIVRQTVGSLTALDFDPVFIADAQKTSDPQWPVTFVKHDMVEGPLPQRYTAAYALDVLEHIAPGAAEASFLTNICSSLEDSGVAVIGMPSIESQGYASPASKEGHINCQSGSQLQSSLLQYFTNCFMFSMNDEVVHTGFQPMAHYLLALCVGPRR